MKKILLTLLLLTIVNLTYSQLNIIAIYDSISCHDGTTDIDIQISNGTAPYTYQWSNGSTEEDLFSTKSGNYIVMVTDSKGVQGIKQIIISQPNQLSIEFEKENNCDKTFKVKGLVSGGNYPYTYKWNNSTQSTNDSVILNPGDYKLSITDSKGCKKTGDIFITEYVPMIIDTSIIDSIECKYKTGGLYVKVINGKTPYTYKWNTNDTNNYLNNIYSGEYSLTVTDDDGCTIKDTFTLENSQHLYMIKFTQIHH